MDGFALLILIAVIGAAVVIAANNKQKRLREAKEAYQSSLEMLKQDPTNADLKQRTLALGREYSNLTRDSKGVTVFDEVALSNDINAACAGAMHSGAPKSAPVSSVDSRLAKLADLKSRGLISDSEYQEQRTRVLREV